MNSWPKQSDVEKFYGTPDANHDGVADRQWENLNLTKIIPPYRMVLAWQTDAVVSRIQVHKKVATSLMYILEKIKATYGSQEAIEAARMHLYGGAYNFRLMRGSNQLSMHSYGCAIDLDPTPNYLGRAWSKDAGPRMMPQSVVQIFKSEGWSWGGDWGRPDCMHFQAATG